MSERWDKTEKYVIISADMHAGAQLREYKDYLPKRWHEEFEPWADNYVSPYDDLTRTTAKRNWDSDFRMSELDADGISAEIIFPNTTPPFFDTVQQIGIGLPKTRDQFERRWVGVQAHNRWLVDFCTKAPTRRRGAAQILPNDIDVALAEIRWAKGTGAFAGVLIPGIPPAHVVEPWFHHRYEPVWALCDELDFPVIQHVGTGNPELPADDPVSHAVLITEMSYWVIRTLPHLILGGVFERHPNLKFVPTEQGTAWVLPLVAQMDFMFTATKGAQKNLRPFLTDEVIDRMPMLPSEYVKRNCYWGASFFSPVEAESRYDLGVDHILWGSDYPHNEGTTPQSREALRWTFAHISDEECRKMLAGNAAALYGFDLDALVPVAKRIGPTVEEIHTPLPNPESTPTGQFARPFEGGDALDCWADEAELLPTLK